MIDFLCTLIYPLVGILAFLIYGGHFTSKYIERNPDFLQIFKDNFDEKKNKNDKDDSQNSISK